MNYLKWMSNPGGLPNWGPLRSILDLNLDVQFQVVVNSGTSAEIDLKMEFQIQIYCPEVRWLLDGLQDSIKFEGGASANLARKIFYWNVRK